MDSSTLIEIGTDLENEFTSKSITGKELSRVWPRILSAEEESKAYAVLFDEGDDRNEPPKHAQIDRLSYELESGDKRLRFFAVFHQRDMRGADDPNLRQYEVLEEKFNESPPELVLYEGVIDNPNYLISRERALELGEQAWMMYLVKQYNGKIKEGEKPIVFGEW